MSKGDSMDRETERQLKKTLQRMTETRRDESICLLGWQVKLVIDYIDELTKHYIDELTKHYRIKIDESEEETK